MGLVALLVLLVAFGAVFTRPSGATVKSQSGPENDDGCDATPARATCSEDAEEDSCTAGACAPHARGSALLVRQAGHAAEALTIRKPSFKARPARSAGRLGEDGSPLEPQERKELEGPPLPCNATHFAPGRHRCPDACPFSSPDAERGCQWRCRFQCGLDEAGFDVPDAGLCRRCLVPGCERCARGRDWCMQCKMGFDLVDGECLGSALYLWHRLYFLMGALLVVIIIWYVSLLFFPVSNQPVLKRALEHRSLASLRSSDDGHGWLPLSTSLCTAPNGKAPIGGPGLSLHFRFQHAIIMWILAVLLGWLVLGSLPGSENLLTVGTLTAEDPQQMCQAVRWGKEAREQLRIRKLIFSVVVYLATSAGAIAFAINQRRRLSEMDDGSSTMMDYAALLKGFPQELGVPGLEGEVQAFLAQATGCQLVGVSVCWNFTDKNDDVQRFATEEVWQREDTVVAAEDGLPPERNSCFSAMLFGPVDRLLGASAAAPAGERTEEEAQQRKSDILELLATLPSSGEVVAVFPSSGERDLAVASLEVPTAPRFRMQYKITAQKCTCEPESVLWENFGIAPGTLALRLALGAAATLAAIAVWGVCFYGPYAYYESSTFEAVGSAPDFATETTFVLLVVVGNQIIYFLCQTVTEKVGFRFVDDQHAAYITIYVAAILVNCVFDLVIVVYTTYLGMVARHVRTDDGILLEALPDVGSVFESYPMMKVLGSTLYEYNFPSCFLLPFLLEGVFAILIPYHIGVRVVGARPVGLRTAEACLAPAPMDLLRYADIILNLTQAMLSFFLTSGWICWTFVGLLAGHIFIYAYDHWRVLRHTASFYFSSDRTEVVTQKLTALPCGILAACVAFQSRGVGLLGLRQQHFAVVLSGAFVLHVALHLSALHWATFHFLAPQGPATEVPYRDAAQNFPANWFTVNPVYCLRSKYLHCDSPPCLLCLQGKEHLIQENEHIGVYYRSSNGSAKQKNS